MARSSWLAVAWIAAFAAQSAAQSMPQTISCSDHAGRAVTGVQVTNGVFAKAKINQDGRPVIEYDPRPVAGISSQQQLFVYAHECGHHALGHDVGGPAATIEQEQQADCYGIRSLTNKVGFTANDVALLQAGMLQLGAGDARRLPWAARAYHLDACLATATSASGTAQGNRGSADAGVDDCVLHQDAANAIVDQSRDRRTIKGLYMVANRCTRDVVCTFTIQTGTLPDADIDAGTWSRFRMQKTRAEQHALKAASEMEFRFEETLDSAPPGESVDFRVLKACH